MRDDPNVGSLWLNVGREIGRHLISARSELPDEAIDGTLILDLEKAQVVPNHRPMAGARTNHKEPIAFRDILELEANIGRITSSPRTAVADVAAGHPTGSWNGTVRFSPPWRMTIVASAEAHKIPPAIDKRVRLGRSMRCSQNADSRKCESYHCDEVSHKEKAFGWGRLLPL